jgi:DNA repair exonuclease SbcCD ATPase subunit
MSNENKANERNFNFNDFLNSDKCHISNYSYSQISISDIEDAWNFCQAQEQKEISELKKKVEELKKSNLKFNAQNTGLMSKCSAMGKENDSLWVENEDLTRKVEELEKENKSLKKKLEEKALVESNNALNGFPHTHKDFEDFSKCPECWGIALEKIRDHKIQSLEQEVARLKEENLSLFEFKKMWQKASPYKVGD